MTQVFESLAEVDVEGPVALTIGTFDGVHRAHHQLIAIAREHAERIGGRSAVLTFQNHPREIVSPSGAPRLLTPWKLKKELIIREGVDILAGIPFDEKLSQTEARDFVEQTIVGKFGARIIISGPDFHFGRGGRGNKHLLRELSGELDFEYQCQEPVLVDGQKLSSTYIRALIENGDVAKAGQLLGRVHINLGPVVTGDRLGRKIGFPTANLSIDERQMLPADGVYAVDTELPDGTFFPGMLNIGWRPTVEGKEHRVEVHLLDFEGELEGQTLRLHYIERIRDEQKFGGLEALRAQLEKDKETTRAIHARQ